jgi:exodeoxyribonuclease-3
MLKSLFSKVIWIGDINVALEEIDVSNPEYMYKYAGFTSLERKSLSMFLSNGWVDIWRHQYPDKVEYSWIGAKKKRRENHGMRLDNIIVTNTIDIDNSSSYIMSDPICDSDHVPVGANIMIYN